MKRLIVKKQFVDIEGMARIGWIPYNTMNTIEVYVHTNDDGKIPHFHIRKYGRNNKFEWETCILYDSADYFLHGRYSDTIPNKIAKELDKMLRMSNPKRGGISFWQTAVDDWNSNNSDIELPRDIEQPDYTTLNK